MSPCDWQDFWRVNIRAQPGGPFTDATCQQISLSSIVCSVDIGAIWVSKQGETFPILPRIPLFFKILRFC
jgi:hypothetical protein